MCVCTYCLWTETLDVFQYRIATHSAGCTFAAFCYLLHAFQEVPLPRMEPLHHGLKGSTSLIFLFEFLRCNDVTSISYKILCLLRVGYPREISRVATIQFILELASRRKPSIYLSLVVSKCFKVFQTHSIFNPLLDDKPSWIICFKGISNHQPVPESQATAMSVSEPMNLPRLG